MANGLSGLASIGTLRKNVTWAVTSRFYRNVVTCAVSSRPYKFEIYCSITRISSCFNSVINFCSYFVIAIVTWFNSVNKLLLILYSSKCDMIQLCCKLLLKLPMKNYSITLNCEHFFNVFLRRHLQ